MLVCVGNYIAELSVFDCMGCCCLYGGHEVLFSMSDFTSVLLCFVVAVDKNRHCCHGANDTRGENKFIAFQTRK
jgi:hypothetical protein